MSIICRDTLGVGSSIYLSVPVHIENLDPAAGGLRQLDPTAFSVCAVLVNAPSARLDTNPQGVWFAPKAKRSPHLYV